MLGQVTTENVVSMVSSTPFLKGRTRGKERNFSYVVVFEFHLGSGVVSLLVSYTVPRILMKYSKQVVLVMVSILVDHQALKIMQRIEEPLV